jgi:hypothetical protein
VSALYSKERIQAAERIKQTLYATLGVIVFIQLCFLFLSELRGELVNVTIIGIIVGILAAAPHITYYIAFWRIDTLRGALDDQTRARIEKAFENVKEFIAKEYLSRSSWKKQIRLHKKLDGKSTKDIEDELRKAGVFNPHNAYYLKGKTLEEGLTLAVWQSRHDRDEAILRATEAAYTQATAQAATAPDPQKRKELERQRESAEQELRRLTGNRIKETYKLSAFGGECQVQYLNNEIEQLVLMVEAGEYSVKLLDVRKDSGDAKRAVVQNDGDPHTLSGWASGFTKDDTELIVKKRGSEAEERKYLW